MKLRVLADNTVLQGMNFLGEHGLSFYIEEGDKKILFDCGYSDVFIKNANKMGINLLDLDYIILSHGHYDHTWGLTHYLPLYLSNIKQRNSIKPPKILTHPNTFNEKYEEGYGEIGSLISEDKLKKTFKLNLSKEPHRITNNLLFLGNIPKSNDFEANEPIKQILKNNAYEDDYILEDSALVYKAKQGIVIITGCSHSGICNIVEYAKKVCNATKVIDIIGGFHLLREKEERLNKTVEYLKTLKLNQIHPCHCTDFNSKMYMSRELNIQETGVGTVLKY